MKLATLSGKTGDGTLVIVSRDISRAVSADSIVPTLQLALEGWSQFKPHLEDLSARLNAGVAPAMFEFDETQALSPLPRAYQWLDASAFLSHGKLMKLALNLTTDPQADACPLIYQGGSDDFLMPHGSAQFPSERDGIDFEGEFAVILNETAMGTLAGEAERNIALVALANDWSLRAYAPREMKSGFGFIQAKPSTVFAPVAVTPDELGGAWREGRVCLPLHVDWNGNRFGEPNGCEMSFRFGDLIAHVCRTRRLRAGTIIGSGTVSNEEAESVGSACIAERRALDTIAGRKVTRFMAYGDTVTMKVIDESGCSVFGTIHQPVVPPTS